MSTNLPDRRRLLTALATGVVLVALTALNLNAKLTLLPLPTIDGYYRFLGLNERAEIIRDAFGVPRIYANNEHDLFFLQGYITAQDRFAQMEEMRSQLPPGTPFLDKPLDERISLAFDAYAAGVTKWIDQQADAGALPAAIALSGKRPRAWTSADSIGISLTAPAWPFLSCAAAGPRESVRGAPLLAVELTTAAPAPGWYEVGLDAQGLRALGISLPGIPGIMAGHNGRLAWAVQKPDVQASIDALAASMVADLGLGTCAADREGNIAGQPMIIEQPLDVETMRIRFAEPAFGARRARIVVDLGDLDASKAALSTGQSGHPASRHYMDQKQLWEAGQLHRLIWTREKIARIEGQLVLRPR